MKHFLLILAGAAAAILLWNVGGAVVGAIPLFVICMMVSIGRNNARKISGLLQQYAENGDRSSPIYELPEEEAQNVLSAICTLSSATLQRARRDYAITLSARGGFFWFLGGNAALRCTLTPKAGSVSPLHTRLSVHYRQQTAVRAWKIICIK